MAAAWTIAGLLAGLCVWLVALSARVRRQAEVFRQVFDASPTPISITRERDGTLLEVNPSFERMFQYARSELVGRTTGDLGLWANPANSQALNQALVGSGRVHDQPVTFVRRDGERLNVLLSMQRIAVAGEPAVLAWVRDVTEQARTDERQHRIDAQIQETRRLEAIGQLAGGIAHDFNNVLQAVKGYTELAVESLPAGHPALMQLGQVNEAADRAATFTTELLNFSRRDAPASSETLILSDVVGQTGALLDRWLGGHIHVLVAEGIERPLVVGGRGQIEQVLMNLCINARDAMPEGGSIFLETGRTAFSPAECTTRPWARAGRWAFVHVRDEGSGIPDDVRPRIFEPFFTTKPAGRGTGLGLSTVYAIVERHGGFIAVETERGIGSTFTVYFPDAGVAEASDKATRIDEGSDAGHGETILIAEDEPFVRELAVEMLEGANYKVLVARDGGEAEALVREYGAAIRAAVLDVVMPVKNGRQVFELLQQTQQKVPVVFCSGYSFGELSDIETLAGVEILTKPYSRASLLAAVRRALQRPAN